MILREPGPAVGKQWHLHALGVASSTSSRIRSDNDQAIRISNDWVSKQSMGSWPANVFVVGAGCSETSLSEF